MLAGIGFDLETARRRQRLRRGVGRVVFTLAGAGLGVYGTLDEGEPLGTVIFSGLVLGIIAFLLSGRGTRAPAPALRHYASGNGLKATRGALPAVTPMLLQPWSRTQGFVEGIHPSGFEGRLGVFNFIRDHRMLLNIFKRMSTYFLWGERGVTLLVAVAELPEDARRTVPVLLCERRYGGKILDAVEEPARGLRRVRLESVALDERYEVFTDPDQEEGWIRRLLSPSMIVWLTAELEEQLSFEIFDGNLTVALPVEGELDLAAVARASELAAEIQRRTRQELSETSLARPPAIS